MSILMRSRFILVGVVVSSRQLTMGGGGGRRGNSWTIVDFSYKIPNLFLLI